jgi:cytidine deaminase
VAAAQAVRAHAYAPYSGFAVGAAILTRTGLIFAGCNVENATFGATLCAERAAIGAMVAAGHNDPVLCTVVSAGPEPATPCGICRQVLVEFAPDLRLLLLNQDETGRVTERRSARLSALLPSPFVLRAMPSPSVLRGMPSPSVLRGNRNQGARVGQGRGRAPGSRPPKGKRSG